MPTNNKGIKSLWGYDLIDEKARNAISDTRSSLENSFQKKTDDTLGTTDKTVPGAINEIKNNIDTIGDNFTSEKTETKYDMKYKGKSIGSINMELTEDKIIGEGGSFNIDLTPYQTKTDTSLTTTNKTIKGAINEVAAQCKDIVTLGYNTSIQSIKNRFESNFVNILDFGAKGDGSTDDSLSFQNAFDYINQNGLKLYIPKGEYIIKNSIVLKENGRYLIEGVNANIDAYNSNINNCRIVCTALDLFKGDNGNSLTNIQITIKNISFAYKGNETINSCLFKDIKLKSSRFCDNSVLGFGSIIEGVLANVTKFYNNFIEGINKGFLTISQFDDGANLVDSEIYSNYINGKPDNNVTIFNISGIAYTSIHNNFIDFAKYVFKGKAYNVLIGLRVYDNTFDYIFRFMPENNFIRKSIINNNKFAKFSKKYISKFPNPDEDMTTKECGVFILPLFEDSIINNSILENCDVFFKTEKTSDCSVKIKNTVYVTEPTIKCVYSIYDKSAYQNTYIEDLDYITVTNFPSNTSQCRNYFNNQHVVYNNKVLRYFENKWYDMMGNEVVAPS